MKETDRTSAAATADAATIPNGKQRVISKKEMMSREGKEIDEKSVPAGIVTPKKEEEKEKEVEESKETVAGVNIPKEGRATGDKQVSSAYESVYSVQYPSTDERQEDESKKSKDKSGGILSGIFKGSKLKKSKSKGSKETSFDSGDEESRTVGNGKEGPKPTSTFVSYDAYADMKPAEQTATDIKLATMQFLDESRRLASEVHALDSGLDRLGSSRG